MKKTCKVCGKVRDMLVWEDTCYQCCNDKYARELSERLKTSEEDSTCREDEIYCPWCGCHYEPELSDGLPEGDTECPECERMFMVTCDVDVRYSTERVTGHD